MLANDSVTLAVEVPIWLTASDIDALEHEHGIRLFDDASTHQSITGHIDFLQIRNEHTHILDYKPDARKETHAHVQLTIYALALARRTSLPLKFFKCGWFDEKGYFDFFPLQGVYTRRNQGWKVGSKGMENARGQAPTTYLREESSMICL